MGTLSWMRSRDIPRFEIPKGIKGNCREIWASFSKLSHTVVKRSALPSDGDALKQVHILKKTLALMYL